MWAHTTPQTVAFAATRELHRIYTHEAYTQIFTRPQVVEFYDSDDGCSTRHRLTGVPTYNGGYHFPSRYIDHTKTYQEMLWHDQRKKAKQRP